jgi:hypothetical protein
MVDKPKLHRSTSGPRQESRAYSGGRWPRKEPMQMWAQRVCGVGVAGEALLPALADVQLSLRGLLSEWR